MPQGVQQEDDADPLSFDYEQAFQNTQKPSFHHEEGISAPVTTRKRPTTILLWLTAETVRHKDLQRINLKS